MATIDVGAVVALLGRELTDAELDRAVTLIELGEGVVEDALAGFSVSTGTESAEVVVHGELWTPRYPVTTVNELAIDGVVVPAESYRFTSKGKFERVRSFAIPINVSWWAAGRICDGTLVTVDYDFGVDPPPYSVVNEIAAAVAATLRRQSTNADGLLSRAEAVDGYNYQDSYGAAEQAALAAGLVVNVDALKRWKRNRQVSVPLTS